MALWGHSLRIFKNAWFERFTRMAKSILALSDHQLAALITNGQFEEINHDDQAIPKRSPGCDP
ncbi:MAG: hypothetical protein EPN21_01420 [Methylococcaceae bacterium]|nr:MAG: hypothetical protein EPN21_01420 [Methylococcaceae bacterium]